MIILNEGIAGEYLDRLNYVGGQTRCLQCYLLALKSMSY